MAYRPPVALYDACVLYPFHLRNVLVQCAVDGLVVARWTDRIHAEWIRALTADHPDLSEERLRHTRDLMNAVLPDADVGGHEDWIEDIHLPDPNDRHVVAAALAGGASVIVTWNVRDFPEDALAPHGVSRADPDSFLSRIFATAPDALIASVGAARRNLRRSTPQAEEFIAMLERQGLTRLGPKLRPRIRKL